VENVRAAWCVASFEELQVRERAAGLAGKLLLGEPSSQATLTQRAYRIRVDVDLHVCDYLQRCLGPLENSSHIGTGGRSPKSAAH